MECQEFACLGCIQIDGLDIETFPHLLFKPLPWNDGRSISLLRKPNPSIYLSTSLIIIFYISIYLLNVWEAADDFYIALPLSLSLSHYTWQGIVSVLHLTSFVIFDKFSLFFTTSRNTVNNLLLLLPHPRRKRDDHESNTRRLMDRSRKDTD